MKLYWIKTPAIVKKLFSGFVWEIPKSEKVVYLTFDDGPTPEITEWVLSELKKHEAKATFFCIGNNIADNPEIFEKVVKSGHAIGNHTFDHVNGWKTATDDYLFSVKLCSNEMAQGVRLFRPPYGKLKPAQAAQIRKIGYKIIMWDVLSADFDASVSPKKCLENVIENVKPGSIVIFHDSVKAFTNLKYALPKTLEFLTANGYRCDVITA